MAKRMSTGKIIERSRIGKKTRVWNYAVIYDSEIGDNASIGSHAEIGGAKIGNNCRIGYGVFICSGVIIEDDCFISPRVCFTNDRNPSVKKATECHESGKAYIPERTLVKKGAVIGSNATILPGITIGESAIIGAGSVVTRDVPSHEIWVGNPARKLRRVEKGLT